MVKRGQARGPGSSTASLIYKKATQNERKFLDQIQTFSSNQNHVEAFQVKFNQI